MPYELYEVVSVVVRQTDAKTRIRCASGIETAATGLCSAGQFGQVGVYECDPQGIQDSITLVESKVCMGPLSTVETGAPELSQTRLVFANKGGGGVWNRRINGLLNHIGKRSKCLVCASAADPRSCQKKIVDSTMLG